MKPSERQHLAVNINAQRGFSKPEEVRQVFEQDDTRERRYVDDFSPVWPRIVDLEQEALNDPSLEDFIQEEFSKTQHNIDKECSDEATDFNSGDSLFRNQDTLMWFGEYFASECNEQNSCYLDGNWPQEYDDSQWDPTDVTNQTLNILPKISDKCLKRIRWQNITSPHFIMVVNCKKDDITIPFTITTIHKNQLGIMLVLFDAVSILIIWLFFFKLQEINQEYLGIIDDMNVQMKDFSIKINDISVNKYTQDSRVLKMKLWQHFNDMLRDRRTLCNQMEILSIELSLYTMQSFQNIFKMQEIQIKITEISAKARARLYDDSQLEGKMNEVKALEERLKKMKDQHKIMIKHRDKTKANTKKLPKNQRIHEVMYVFVVFRDPFTRDEVLQMFEKDVWVIRIINKIFYKNAMKVLNKQFDGKDMVVEESLEPDEIIWENLAYSKQNQQYRSYMIQLIAVLFIIFMTILTIQMEGVTTFLEFYVPSKQCPQFWEEQDPYNETYMKDALDDFYLPSEFQQNLMGCYCARHSSYTEIWTLFDIQFTDEARGFKKRKICLEVCLQQLMQQATIAIGDSIAPLLNAIIAIIFQRLGHVLKKHTKVDEQATQFKYIFFLEFINLGIISLVSSQGWFTPMVHGLIGWTGQSKIMYSGFEPAWYMNTGKAICFYVFLSPIYSNTQDLQRFGMVLLRRYFDRKFKINIKKDPGDEGDDRVNTRQKLQSKVVQLYTGQEFEGEKAYSRMMSILFCIMIYSGGMPILYFIGFALYSWTYIVKKILIIKYYQTSRTLTRTIPRFSVKFLNVALVFHMIGAVLMLMNKEAFQTLKVQDQIIEFNAVEEFQNLEEEYVQTQTGSELSVTDSTIGQFSMFHQQLYIIFIIAFVVLYLIGRTLFTITMLIVNGVIGCMLKIWRGAKHAFNKYCRKNRIGDEDDLDQKEYLHSSASSSGGSHSHSGHSEEPSDTESESEAASSDSCDHQLDETPGESKVDKDYKTLMHSLKHSVAPAVAQKAKILKEEARERKGVDRMERHAKLAAQREKKRQYVLRYRKMRPDYSENIIQELNCENLGNLYQRAQKELEDFLDLFNLENDQLITKDLLEPETAHEKKIVFLEICFLNRVTSDQAYKYQKWLLKRIHDIEHVIDHHFNLVKLDILKKMKSDGDQQRKKLKEGGFEVSISQQVKELEEEAQRINAQKRKFDQHNYPKTSKMKALLQHQDDLIKADKARNDNRTGTNEILRMSGSLTQSYFIFDSQQYKVARRIYYLIDKEDENLKVPGMVGQLQYGSKGHDPDHENTMSDVDGLESRSRSSRRSSTKKSSRSLKSAPENQGSQILDRGGSQKGMKMSKKNAKQKKDLPLLDMDTPQFPAKTPNAAARKVDSNLNPLKIQQEQ